MKTIGCVSKIVILIGLISIYGVNAQGPVGAPAPTVSVGPAIAPISGPPAAPIAPASVPSSSVTPAAAPALPGFIPALAPFDALVPSPVSRPPTPSPAQAPTPTRGPTNAPVPASRPVFAPIPVPNAPSAFPATATPPPSVLSVSQHSAPFMKISLALQFRLCLLELSSLSVILFCLCFRGRQVLTHLCKWLDRPQGSCSSWLQSSWQLYFGRHIRCASMAARLDSDDKFVILQMIYRHITWWTTMSPGNFTRERLADILNRPRTSKIVVSWIISLNIIKSA